MALKKRKLSLAILLQITGVLIALIMFIYTILSHKSEDNVKESQVPIDTASVVSKNTKESLPESNPTTKSNDPTNIKNKQIQDEKDSIVTSKSDTCEITLIISEEICGAKIFLDDEPYGSFGGDRTTEKIQVMTKEGWHNITLKKGEKSWEREILIDKRKLRVTFY